MTIERPRDDAGYFHTRAIEEQVAAQRAICPAARERHEELAAVYRFKERFACEVVETTPHEHATAGEFKSAKRKAALCKPGNPTALKPLTAAAG